jgi:TM2 domain-containing membrane protein YozV
VPAQKSKIAAGLLGIFLGWLGIHRFYLGYVGIGIAQIAVTVVTFGIGGLWGFIEGILILTGSINKDANGRPLGP